MVGTLCKMKRTQLPSEKAKESCSSSFTCEKIATKAIPLLFRQFSLKIQKHREYRRLTAHLSSKPPESMSSHLKTCMPKVRFQAYFPFFKTDIKRHKGTNKSGWMSRPLCGPGTEGRSFCGCVCFWIFWTLVCKENWERFERGSIIVRYDKNDGRSLGFWTPPTRRAGSVDLSLLPFHC